MIKVSLNTLCCIFKANEPVLFFSIKIGFEMTKRLGISQWSGHQCRMIFLHNFDSFPCRSHQHTALLQNNSVNKQIIFPSITRFVFAFIWPSIWTPIVTFFVPKIWILQLWIVHKFMPFLITRQRTVEWTGSIVSIELQKPCAS